MFWLDSSLKKKGSPHVSMTFVALTDKGIISSRYMVLSRN